ncbi:Myrcene synthase, chloroplastic [Quillaja saponaria]|uniref:Myrcene synthase, chloroplastic n=1 Tax=Quillaja saponaria TaxID=32244 RepID=A0AAD7L3F9_QUISA|nr:Myrcene synthase, chloroplastic [Quillaja saponaria]
MAFVQFPLLQISNFIKLPSLERKFSLFETRSKNIKCNAVTDIIYDHKTVRRSANFQPTIWHNDYIQSLTTEYVEESYSKQHNMLQEEVRMILRKVANPLHQLELIDILQRLGLSYRFRDEIKRILDNVYNNSHGGEDTHNKDNILYSTSLEFRLLRQHGYHVSTEVFNSFQNLCNTEDIDGMLSLYEASYLLVESETILDEARDFTSKHLSEFVSRNKDGNNITSALVSHALELPLHWRIQRLEARWFIGVYERFHNMNPLLLELAKLDFNMVQATHQEDLKQASSWWKKSGLGEKLSFARDRLMENFFWTVGIAYEPHLGHSRRMFTKINALITVIDDIYDVYGTLEELELFTDFIDRWDTKENDTVLPDYMKTCFFALNSCVEEMALYSLKEHGFHITRYLKKAWADLCKSYLVEAKWYHSGYIPTLQEYSDNAWVSISAPAILVYAYFLVSNSITNEALECLEDSPDIIHLSAMILRLADDLGSSSRELETGDVAKSIQCYMKETNSSEEDAREHVMSLIHTTWKNMNKELVSSSPFCEAFKQVAVNLGRMALCMYQHGDGHTVQDPITNDRILSLVIHPIPLAHRKY